MTGKLGGGLGAARAGHSHQGIDILGPVGSQIYASGAGTIIKHNPTGSFQNDAVTTIRLDDGRIVRYMHHKLDPNLKEGQRVTPGQPIGSSGSANGVPHLHYDIKRPGQAGYLDPEREHGWRRGREGVAPHGGLTSPSGGVLANVDASAKVSAVTSNAAGAGGRQLTGGATIPKGTDPETVAAINRVASAHNLDPAAIAGVIKTESNWNPRATTGRYKGLTQIGPEQAAYGNIQNMSPSQQVEAYGKWLDYYKFNDKAKTAGVDLSKMSAAQQAAYLQGFQFAPNATGWQKAYGAGEDTGRTTPTRQASALGDTSMRQMTQYYDKLLGRNPASYVDPAPTAVAANSNVPALADDKPRPGPTIERAALNRESLTADKSKVDTDGKLSASVDAPAGTKVEVSGSGAFKKTETERSTPMSRETANKLLAAN